ncbi:VOC family protein [Chondromyces crocatus]|uniref:Transposase n=1 Tax=Chondromyces crocatus TaxID=52 RepID=A0A0K1EBC6_CHOCO|nr:VOC family protein [Chondromyces crocatus]AKT37987.1 transposase [Chondromyces crocatus]
MAVHYIPPKYQAAVPYLIVEGADALIAFLKEVFGAELMERHANEAGKVMNASVRLDDTVIEVADGNATWKPGASALHVYVSDVDAVYERALAAGATSTGKPEVKPYGERGAGVQDRWGNHWFIATYLGQNAPQT